MTDLTLEGLKARTTKSKERAKKRAKTSYHLARSLGFNTYEAMALQNHSETTIRRLAQERATNVKE